MKTKGIDGREGLRGEDAVRGRLGTAPSPQFFVSADSKGLSGSVSALESTLMGRLGSVDSKEDTEPEWMSEWRGRTDVRRGWRAFVT